MDMLANSHMELTEAGGGEYFESSGTGDEMVTDKLSLPPPSPSPPDVSKMSDKLAGVDTDSIDDGRYLEPS